MIEINNLTRRSIDKKFLEKVAKKVLRGENQTSRYAPCNRTAIKEERAKISVALIGKAKIKKLNRKYRGKDKPTDVLSFGKSKKFLNLPGIKENLGEIVICLEIVEKNAKKYSVAPKRELARVLIHGILHLVGYEHKKSARGSRKMQKKQEYYLSKI